MKNTEQSSTPSATPTKRFYRLHNVIMMTHDVYHTIEAESVDEAMRLIHDVDCFDNIEVDDFVECSPPRYEWECVEVPRDGNGWWKRQADGNEIPEDDDEIPLDKD